MSEFTEARLSSVFEEMNPGDSGPEDVDRLNVTGVRSHSSVWEAVFGSDCRKFYLFDFDRIV